MLNKICTMTAKSAPYPPCTVTAFWPRVLGVPGPCPDAASGNTTSPYCRAVSNNKILYQMKILISLTLSFLALWANSQDIDAYWQRWDSRYPSVDIARILNYEKHYADSVEANHKIPQFYARADRYRFKVEFIGSTRELDKSILSSMKTVYKLFMGNPAFMDTLFRSEVLIKLKKDSIWMPVQNQILNALKQEISPGDTISIYCLFLNEHSTQNGLRNIFLISEFNTK
jgi:hypothetical protein